MVIWPLEQNQGQASEEPEREEPERSITTQASN